LLSLRKIQAQPLTDQSWILTDPQGRLGILSYSNDVYKLLASGNSQEFANLDQLQTSQGWSVTFVVKSAEAEKTVCEIDHLPIKHPDPQNIQREPVISYSKQATSSVRFAAGYWGLKFLAWQGSFCPKLQTLDEYEHVGPFQTKLEMNTILAKKNNELNKQK
jgi:hypothetical protein